MIYNYKNQLLEIPDMLIKDYKKNGFSLDNKRIEYFIVSSCLPKTATIEEIKTAVIEGIKKEILFNSNKSSSNIKMTISKQNYNESDNEQIHLIINNVDVGTYSSNLYNKWYIKRINEGKRTIPDISKYIIGLIYNLYNIDLYYEKDMHKINQIIGYENIAKWFESYMESEYVNN